MIQQVNLYQPILRREKKVFSATTMLQVLAMLTAFMLLLFGFNRWQLERLESESARLRAQEVSLAQRVAAVSSGMRVRPESRELRETVERAERELGLKQRLADLMQDRPASGGFATAFAGLARQRINGLWLTGIEVKNLDIGRSVTLRGLASRAELVPELVQQLGNEPAFEGLQFKRMRVYQPENGPANALAFELATDAAKETDK